MKFIGLLVLFAMVAAVQSGVVPEKSIEQLLEEAEQKSQNAIESPDEENEVAAETNFRQFHAFCHTTHGLVYEKLKQLQQDTKLKAWQTMYEVFVQSSDTAGDVWKVIAAQAKASAVNKLEPPKELGIEVETPEINAAEVKAVCEANPNAPFIQNAVKLVGAGVREVTNALKQKANAAFQDFKAMLNVPEITNQIIEYCRAFQLNFVQPIAQGFKGFRENLAKNGAKPEELPLEFSALKCMTVRRVSNINKFCLTATTIGPLIPTLVAKTTQ